MIWCLRLKQDILTRPTKREPFHWGIRRHGHPDIRVRARVRESVRGVHDNWPWQTDREPTDRKQTDSEQRQLAEKGDPKYIFTIPIAILPKPSLCDEITATKSVTKSCNKIIALRSVCSRSVCCGQLTWLRVRASGCPWPQEYRSEFSRVRSVASGCRRPVWDKLFQSFTFKSITMQKLLLQDWGWWYCIIIL